MRASYEAKALRRSQLLSESAARHLEVQAQQRRQSGPACEACGRPTEYLFDGPVLAEVVTHELDRYTTTGWTLKPMLKRQMQSGKVCQRCRPPSNLEIQEILGRYAVQPVQSNLDWSEQQKT